MRVKRESHILQLTFILLIQRMSTAMFQRENLSMASGILDLERADTKDFAHATGLSSKLCFSLINNLQSKVETRIDWFLTDVRNL